MVRRENLTRAVGAVAGESRVHVHTVADGDTAYRKYTVTLATTNILPFVFIPEYAFCVFRNYMVTLACTCAATYICWSSNVMLELK
jgi:hypothetical protein